MNAVAMQDQDISQQSAPVITADIQQRCAAIVDEMRATVKDRNDVIYAMMVARVAQQHFLMLGPGGTGKSFLVRDFVRHIDGAKHFETALDETTDPGQVFGPPDIPAMVKEGRNRRVVTNMLPEATDAFVDEIFNGNSPVLHSLMPIMNERIFHNNGMPSDVPLRSLYAGTNKLNADSDLAAFFDRLHHRYVVDYVKSRKDQSDMVGEAVARLAMLGRGMGTSLSRTPTMVTLAELDQAHNEALSLTVDDVVMDMFLDLTQTLKADGVLISDRRKVEGMVAVLANAWLRGHESVKAGDLDILAGMWWTVKDQSDQVRQAVLAIANPGEKAALDLTKDFREIEASLRQAQSNGTDAARLSRVGVEVIRTADKILGEANTILAKAVAAGASTQRLDELISRVVDFKRQVGADIFNLTPENVADLNKA